MFPNENDYSKLLKDTTPPTDVEKEQQRRANALNAAMHMIADSEILCEVFAKGYSTDDFATALCEYANVLYDYVYGEPDQDENFNTRA